MADDTDSEPNPSRASTDTADPEWGSDYIVDFLDAYGFDYVSFNPGASFRGLEESIVNYNDDAPEVIETTHEGLSVSIAHGYAKATGEPALCILHNVVGTLHGTMSLFNAYCDRVPVLALSGTGPMRKSHRRPWIEWIHTALVQGDLVRGFVKWDDQPDHIDGAADSLLRAIRIADTPPKGPTYVTIDHELQEGAPPGNPELPDFEKFAPPTRPAPDPAAVEEAADLLVDAEFPVILVDQVGDSRAAVDALVDLAETLGAPVVDPRYRRYNFPNTHPLNHSDSDVVREADAVLALDVWSPNYVLRDVTDSSTHEMAEVLEDFTLVDVGMHDLEVSSLVPNYYGLRETDVPIRADTELAIPALRDAVAERLTANSPLHDRVADRSAALAERHAARREAWEEVAEAAWDERPVSLPRLAAELWDVVRDDPWTLVQGTLRGWTHRLWEVDEFDDYVGGDSGGGGVGYGIGGAIGGALAYADSERVPINIQPDGDLMFYPGGLWTVGHYELPMLTVVHNNGSYYNSTAHRMRLAEYRGRDASYERALVGTGLNDPTPGYATIAEGMGVNGYGPVEDPDDLAPALEAAWEDVLAGEPALVDVVSQSR